MLGNLMGRMQEEQFKLKEKLSQIEIISNFQNGQLQIITTAEKKIKDIKIDDNLLQNIDNETLCELLTTSINHALEQSEAKAQEETRKLLQDILPNIPGLNL